MMRFTEQDFHDAVTAATKETRLSVMEVQLAEKATTVADLALAMGCGEAKIRKALRALAAQGRLEAIQMRRTSITGVPVLIPGYLIKAAPGRGG
jgi:predicted ArsR family transcriptional regulator